MAAGLRWPLAMAIGELHVLPTPEEVAEAAAEFVATAVAETQEERFTIALAGGSTPRRLYQLLAAAPYVESIAWSRWHVFWGDERCVPPEHPDSNYRMAGEALLDHVPLLADQIHRLRGEAAPQEAAEEYERELQRVFQASMPVFDLLLLGLGEDGHTASLFPRTAALQEGERLVAANWAPQFEAHRLTFTVPLINAARRVVFLVADAAKAKALRQVLTPVPTEQPLPAAMVRPTPGVLHWFVTSEAAACLRQ